MYIVNWKFLLDFRTLTLSGVKEGRGPKICSFFYLNIVQAMKPSETILYISAAALPEKLTEGNT